MSALIVLALLLALGFFGANLVVSAAVLGMATFALLLLGHTSAWVLIPSFALAAIFALLALPSLRTKYLSQPFLHWFRQTAPKLSTTEQEALDAGTTWWDGELFSGKPDWNRLLTTPKPQLRPDEQAFLDGPVETLCNMLDDWQVQGNKDLPTEAWDYLRKNGFFSLIIGKEYGGLGFSPTGNSAVVTKIASCNLTAAVTVMVPNSLGPGELLRDFGTQQQRDHYLPRLARGDDIPCFALTGPTAGSDAAAMPDTGVVCRGLWQGQEVLGLRLNWNKRYITLAPVATVLGLAFQARDPDGLLGTEDDLGITCALIPVSTPGVYTGNRHLPVGSVFMNGPTQGENVFIPLDYVIGGRERIGQGWRMLMHSLAAGRAISLPALGTAGTKCSARYSGEYARLRKQFGLPIGYFEGVEEPLARMAGEAYRVDAARLLTLGGLALGEKPSVLSAILKYHATEANRRCVNDAMDVHGGKGIILGPSNYLAAMYQSLPVAITVEGANILTRSLIIFGQGVIRNHPYIQREIEISQREASADTTAAFDKVLFGHIGFVINNLCRALVFGLTGARLIKAPVQGRTAHYYRQLTRLSSDFALVADCVLLTLGGSFKFKEKISGRLADVVTHLYLASAILKRFEDDGCPPEDHPLVHWGVRDSLFQAQNALVNCLRNFPMPVLGKLILWLIFPLGRPYKEPSDRLGKYVARILHTPGPARDRLCQGLFEGRENSAVWKLNKAFQGIQAIASSEKLLKKQLGIELGIHNYLELTERASAQGLIDGQEAARIVAVYDLIRDVINVDDFAPGSL